ncbi:unnamed protein product, partial [Vitis vinifera]|uniref:Uncharacterized protein n=1 Tax=Vitis vinifera TaxID=29760 RepID=D7U8P9_VITVI
MDFLPFVTFYNTNKRELSFYLHIFLQKHAPCRVDFASTCFMTFLGLQLDIEFLAIKQSPFGTIVKIVKG